MAPRYLSWASPDPPSVGWIKTWSKTKNYKNTSSFYSGRSTSTRASFFTLGRQTTDPVARRYQKRLGRRQRQRARRRAAALAARCAREKHRSELDIEEPVGRNRSTRNRRRHRLRILHRRSVACQREWMRIATQVSHSGGTERMCTTPSSIRDWRSIATSENMGCTEFIDRLREQLAGSWDAVQPEGVVPGTTRTSDDGILLVIPARVFGKPCRALVDSGASRSFVSPDGVLKLGLHCVNEPCMLELADGQKILSNGKVPHALISVASSTAKVDLTVTPLLQDVDVILGVTWLATVNPLIDWATPRIILPDSLGTTSMPGQWLDKVEKVGQIRVLRSFSHPSHPSQYSLLSSPSFWTYAPSGHAWSRAYSTRGVKAADKVDCSIDGTAAVVHQSKDQEDQSHCRNIAKVKTTVMVQGHRHQKVQSKESRQRQFLKPSTIKKIAKRGEPVFLAIVRRVQKEQERSFSGKLSAMRSKKK